MCQTLSRVEDVGSGLECCIMPCLCFRDLHVWKTVEDHPVLWSVLRAVSGSKHHFLKEFGTILMGFLFPASQKFHLIVERDSINS